VYRAKVLFAAVAVVIVGVVLWAMRARLSNFAVGPVVVAVAHRRWRRDRQVV
jgi:membrane protein implicated in regulation of membrane protease activity